METESSNIPASITPDQATRLKLWPQGDEILVRPVGTLAQSFDHRAVDGACSAAFLARVKQLIENEDWTQEFDL